MATNAAVCVCRRGLNPPHRVKSISMTTFSLAEIEALKKGGNEVRLTLQYSLEHVIVNAIHIRPVILNGSVVTVVRLLPLLCLSSTVRVISSSFFKTSPCY